MKKLLLALGAAALVAVAFAMPAKADTYDFTYLGSNYSASGTFDTGAADGLSDGGFQITSLSGTLISANPAFVQGAFSLLGGNATGISSGVALLSPSGLSTYSNLYVPGAQNFAGAGILASGATFVLNLYNGVNGSYPACASDCASVVPNLGADQGFYNPGEGGVLTISAVPEPAVWAMFLLGFGAVGFAMRKQRSAGSLRLA